MPLHVEARRVSECSLRTNWTPRFLAPWSSGLTCVSAASLTLARPGLRGIESLDTAESTGKRNELGELL